MDKYTRFLLTLTATKDMNREHIAITMTFFSMDSHILFEFE